MTSGPGAQVGAIVPVDLPRPRRRGSPGFGEMWEHINTIIESEQADVS